MGNFHCIPESCGRVVYREYLPPVVRWRYPGEKWQEQVGSALSEVKKLSDTLEQTAVNSAIAPHEKYRIQQLTEKSTAVLEQVESDIEQSTEKLILLEEEP